MARTRALLPNSLFRHSRAGSPLRQPAAVRAPGVCWALGGLLLGTLWSLLLWAPAWWLAAALGHASSGQVQLLNAQGTVWSGSGQLVLTAGTGASERSALPGRVQWTVRPQWHGLQIAVGADCCLPAPWLWTAQPGWNGASPTLQLTVSDSPSRWPAAVLQGLGTPWNTLQLDGTLGLKSQQLAVLWGDGRWQLSGAAQVDALSMASSISPLKPIGSYRLVLLGGESATLQLSTLEGALQLQGQGQWLKGRLHFGGEATAAAGREAALANLLNIMGRRDGARSIITLG